MALHLTWAFVFGLLGNIISSLVCLAPVPTFYQICKKKTSEGFQSIPYVIALLSAMLWLFYAVFAEDATLLITVNTFTFLLEIAYLALYFFYATKKDKILTAKLVFLFNVFGFGIISIVAMFILHGKQRVNVLGWICMIFALCVFVAPLAIVRKVIKTKSVEFMPISLSFFLTLSAVMWFLYGFLRKDYFVAIPNVLGFIFGMLQMLLYAIYRLYPHTAAIICLASSPRRAAARLPSVNLYAGYTAAYQTLLAAHLDRFPPLDSHDGSPPL